MVFGIRDTKIKERLLRDYGLTLAKTDEVSRAPESMITQIKIVKDAETDVNKVNTVNASCKRDPNTRLIVAGNEGKVKASNVKTVVTNTGKIGNRVQHLERTSGDAEQTTILRPNVDKT